MAHEGNKNPLGLSENENTVYSNLWDTMKAILKAKLLVLSAYNKKLLDLVLVT